MRTLLFTFTLCFMSSLLSAQTYVNASATGANDGSSWADAYTDLQSALSTATSGDDIWIAAGTYKPTSGTSRTALFNIPSGVSIYGGFPNTGNPTMNDRDLDLNKSILDGDLLGNDGPNLANSNENSHTVVRITGLTAPVYISGIVIRGGRSDGSGFLNQNGGGLYVAASDKITIEDCIIKENYGGNAGGCYGSTSTDSLVFERCQFIGNRAYDDGGGFASNGNNTNGYFIFSNTLFANNRASNSGSAAAGGGLRLKSNSFYHFYNVTIANNTTGGGIDNYDVATSRVVIRNSIVHSNGTNAVNLVGGFTIFNSCIQSGYTGNGNTNANPQFTNMTGGDYTLQATSPAIDAGNNTSVVGALDLALNSRIYNATVDMGAYEQACQITVGVTADTAICEGGSIQLQATGGMSYSWSPATGLSNPNIANPIATPTATTTYTVTVTDSTNCSDSAMVTITVNNNPIIEGLSDTVMVCLYDSVQLDAAVPGSNITYSWSPATGLSNPNINNPMASPSMTTTYTLTVTDGNGCMGSQDVVVEVTECCSTLNLVANFSATVNGTEVTLVDNSTGLQIDFINWDFGDNSTQSDLPGATRKHTYAANGTYNVCLDVYALLPGGTCCKATICIPVTINVDPCSFYTADFSVNGFWGTKRTFTDMSTPGTQFTNWDFGDGGTAVSLGSGSKVAHKYPGPGMYTVRMVSVIHLDSVTCCRDTVYKTIKIMGKIITINNGGYTLAGLGLRYDSPDNLPVTITIVNMAGQIVRKVFDDRDGQEEFDMQDLPSGVYVITVEGDGFRESKKFFKQ